LLHQVGDLFELNVKLRCQKVNVVVAASETHRNNTTQRGQSGNTLVITILTDSGKLCNDFRLA